MKFWFAVDLVGGEKKSPDFKTEKFLLVQPISPESGAPFTLTVSSDGPGALQTESIGVYEKLNILKNSRPAWQHIDTGYYISHNGERWYVTDDLYDTEGYRFLRSAITSETMPPSSDWEYWDGTDWSNLSSNHHCCIPIQFLELSPTQTLLLRCLLMCLSSCLLPTIQILKSIK